jgi:flagellar hook capping protein FlgD
LQRVLTTATLVGLLIATAAAFAITERLKLVKSPVTGTHISKVFSPTCSCARGKANISIKLRHGDTVTIEILDSKLRSIRLLVGSQPVPRGRSVFRWDGRTNFGERAPEGVYRVQIHLDRQHRTILFPNRIVLDISPPKVLDARPSRLQFSPDGDQLGDAVSIRYRLSKRAAALVYLGDRRIIRSHSKKLEGSVVWTGRLDGTVLKPGTYTLTVGAVDLAGNVTPAAERVRVRVEIRYIALASSRIVAGAGQLVDVGVSTDAERYAWQIGARKGTWSGPVLPVRAPTTRGRYTLTVTYRGHRDRAAVIVR